MDYLIRKYVIVTNDHSHDRETIGYLMTALNLEKSGDCMGADMLFEKENLWSLAGKVRERGHMEIDNIPVGNGPVDLTDRHSGSRRLPPVP